MPALNGDDRALPSRKNFITRNTAVLMPPLVPEVRLHLAEESLPIWKRTEEDFGRINVPPPFWAFAWAGGQALARYLLDHPELCRARRVLDIGAGSGLVAIAAMKAGAQNAMAADVDGFAVVASTMNAALNGVRIDTTEADLLDGPPPPTDVLLIGDLFYEEPVANRVLAFAKAAQKSGTLVLVGDPRRSYFPQQAFDLIAEYDVPVTRELEDAEIKRASVWKLPD